MLRNFGIPAFCILLVEPSSSNPQASALEGVRSCFSDAAQCHDAEPEALALVQQARRYTKSEGANAGKPYNSGLIQFGERAFASTISFLAAASSDDIIQYYEYIQRKNSTTHMRDFVDKLFWSAGGRVQDMGQIMGIIPYYSGEKATQSWTTFWEEMARAKLLPHGKDALFTETGYWAVAAQKSHAEMLDYVKRVIKSEGGNLLDEGALPGFVNFYSGEIAIGTLAQMREDLTTKSVAQGWVEFMTEFKEEEFNITQEQRNTTKMAGFLHKFLACSGGQPPAAQDMSFVAQFYSGERALQSANVFLAESLRSGWLANSSTAAFTEAGYKSIAVRRDSKEMLYYVYRLIGAEGGRVNNFGKLYSFIPDLNGEEQIQSFYQLKRELSRIAETEGWLEYASFNNRYASPGMQLSIRVWKPSHVKHFIG